MNALVIDMRTIFGERLQSVVVYRAAATSALSASTSEPIHTLTLVDQVRSDDLSACAGKYAVWERQGLATPLLMSKHEFVRSLDSFPLEYGHIIASHRVIAGPNPFEGMSVNREDLRRACEVQTKSHLIHLRQAYIETAGRPAAVAQLIAASAAPLRALLASVARLRGNADDHTDLLVRESETMGLPPAVIRRVLELKTTRELQPADAVSFFPAYLKAIEQLAKHVDEWNR